MKLQRPTFQVEMDGIGCYAKTVLSGEQSTEDGQYATIPEMDISGTNTVSNNKPKPPPRQSSSPSSANVSGPSSSASSSSSSATPTAPPSDSQLRLDQYVSQDAVMRPMYDHMKGDIHRPETEYSGSLSSPLGDFSIYLPPLPPPSPPTLSTPPVLRNFKAVTNFKHHQVNVHYQQIPYTDRTEIGSRTSPQPATATLLEKGIQKQHNRKKSVSFSDCVDEIVTFQPPYSLPPSPNSPPPLPPGRSKRRTTEPIQKEQSAINIHTHHTICPRRSSVGEKEEEDEKDKAFAVLPRRIRSAVTNKRTSPLWSSFKKHPRTACCGIATLVIIMLLAATSLLICLAIASGSITITSPDVNTFCRAVSEAFQQIENQDNTDIMIDGDQSTQNPSLVTKPGQLDIGLNIETQKDTTDNSNLPSPPVTTPSASFRITQQQQHHLHNHQQQEEDAYSDMEKDTRHTTRSTFDGTLFGLLLPDYWQ